MDLGSVIWVVFGLGCALIKCIYWMCQFYTGFAWITLLSSSPTWHLCYLNFIAFHSWWTDETFGGNSCFPQFDSYFPLLTVHCLCNFFVRRNNSSWYYLPFLLAMLAVLLLKKFISSNDQLYPANGVLNSSRSYVHVLVKWSSVILAFYYEWS